MSRPSPSPELVLEAMLDVAHPIKAEVAQWAREIFLTTTWSNATRLQRSPATSGRSAPATDCSHPPLLPRTAVSATT